VLDILIKNGAVNDAELLQLYVSKHSEEAFAEIVRKHLNLVYGTALREMAGDTTSAEDICQSVFLELAKKAPSLRRHPALAGWLYSCVRYTAANLRRTEARRHRREKQAQIMSEILQPGTNEAHWEEVKPALDNAMHELNEIDRAAVVLRFFEQRTIEQVGLALGLNKSAAHMRIDRALDKLRKLLSKRGVTSTSTALPTALAVGAVIVAPENLANAITANILAKGVSGSSTAMAIKFMTLTKSKLALTGILISAGIAMPMLLQYRTQLRLERENRALRAQVLSEASLAGENWRLSDQVSPLPIQVTRLPLSESEHSELLPLRGKGTRLPKERQEQQIRSASVLSQGSTVLSTDNNITSTNESDNQFRRAFDQVKQSLDSQATDTNDGSIPDGAVSVVADEAGNRHIVEFTNGAWQEADPKEGLAITPEGSLVKSSPNAISAPGDQMQYSVVTNSSAATNP
jgi:RNA polymerase sigma factor (sigma-70 family)